MRIISKRGGELEGGESLRRRPLVGGRADDGKRRVVSEADGTESKFCASEPTLEAFRLDDTIKNNNI